MKYIIFLISFISFSYSEQYTFLVNNKDKELELEAKIISNIATSSIKNEIKLYIPEISNIEKEIYSKFFILSDDCLNANFIFVKRNVDINLLCKNENKIFFTNNYDLLLKNNHFIGAFFWSKSRPNIVFVKNRLVSNNIKLPENYDKFIEEF